MRGLVASLLLAASSAAPPPARFSTFPPGTPSTTFPDGPFLGNGATGVVVGGAPGTITLYFALSGFWSSGYGHNSSMPPLAEGPLSFPGCPSNNCSITVGLTLATVTLQSEALAAKAAAGAARRDANLAAATQRRRLLAALEELKRAPASKWASAVGEGGGEGGGGGASSSSSGIDLDALLGKN